MNVEPNYNSSSSSLDEEEESDMFFLLMFVENKNNYIPKEPQHISMLTGDAFIKEILNGNSRMCYELSSNGQHLQVSVTIWEHISS